MSGAHDPRQFADGYLFTRHEYAHRGQRMAPGRVIRCATLVCVGAGVLTQFAACAGAPRQAAQPRMDAGSAPVVISTIPNQAAQAYDQSERKLTHAKWGVLDKMGPHRAMLEKLTTSNDNTLKQAEADAPRSAHPLRFSTIGSESDESNAAASTTQAQLFEAKDQAAAQMKSKADAMAKAPASAKAKDPAKKSADAAKVKAAQAKADQAVKAAAQAKAKTAATAKAANQAQAKADQAAKAASAAAKALASAQAKVATLAQANAKAMARRRKELPLTVLPLPGDQVQLIWNLRSIGGTTVSARRDHGTSRREVSIKPPDLKPLVKVVQARLGKKGVVMPLPQRNALVITCPKTLQSPIIDLLCRLDVPRVQVHITAKIFETSHDFDYQQGARLVAKRIAQDGTQSVLSTFDTQRLLDKLTGGSAPYEGSVLGMTQTLEKAGMSINASLQLLAETGLISVVSSPRMTVAAGQTGYMLAGKELPIQSTQIDGSTLKISTTYKPVGVQLYISPESAGDDWVKLHLIAVVSSVQGFTPVPTLTSNNNAALLVNPIIKSREAETVVTIKPGNTLVISGMKMIRSISRENKIPGLGDIPLIGAFFKNHRSQRQMTDLYFFITPTLAMAD